MGQIRQDTYRVARTDEKLFFAKGHHPRPLSNMVDFLRDFVHVYDRCTTRFNNCLGKTEILIAMNRRMDEFADL